MVAVSKEVLRFANKVVSEVGDLLDDAQGAERCLLGSQRLETGRWIACTFLRMYVLLDPRSFSISLARSRDISSDAMLANVQSANPTAYMFEWFMSLRYRQLTPQGSRIYALLERIRDEG